MTDKGVMIASGTGSYLRVRQKDIAGLTLREELYSNEVLEPIHSHKLAYFKVILKGAITEREKRRTLEHRALSVAFQPVEEPHSSHVLPEGLHYLKILMDPKWLKRIADDLERPYTADFSRAANFANGTLPWLG